MNLKDSSDSDDEADTECTRCNKVFTESQFIRHSRQCRANKRARDNPDVDTAVNLSHIVDHNVSLPDDDSENSSLDLDVALESRLFGDPYLETLMMEKL